MVFHCIFLGKKAMLSYTTFRFAFFVFDHSRAQMIQSVNIPAQRWRVKPIATGWKKRTKEKPCLKKIPQHVLKKKNISSKSYSLTLGVRQHLISFIPQRFNNRYQGLRSQGVETSGVEQSSCDSRFWVPPNRQSKMAGIILDRQRDYPANLSHFPVAFICCKQ